MNRLKMHWEKVRSILIGAVMIGLLLFIWYSVGLYRQKKAVKLRLKSGTGRRKRSWEKRYRRKSRKPCVF